MSPANVPSFLMESQATVSVSPVAIVADGFHVEVVCWIFNSTSADVPHPPEHPVPSTVNTPNEHPATMVPVKSALYALHSSCRVVPEAMAPGGATSSVVVPSDPRETFSAGSEAAQPLGRQALASAARVPALHVTSMSPWYPVLTVLHATVTDASWASASVTVWALSEFATDSVTWVLAAQSAVRDTSTAAWLVARAATSTSGISTTSSTTVRLLSATAGVESSPMTTSAPDAVAMASTGVLSSCADTCCSSAACASSAAAPSPPVAAAVAGSGSTVISNCVTTPDSRRPSFDVSRRVPGTSTTLILSGDSPSSTAMLVTKFSPVQSLKEIWISIFSFTVGVLRMMMSAWPLKAASDPFRRT
mmetsp:Transcript_17434/g.44342  ORF Transcript_17434/g.44342 Transcript_17434/m.44342 type:complete len:362 (-) Transcript_17434:3171-4256(-)